MHNFTHVEHTSEEGQQYIFWCYSDMPGMLEVLFRRLYGTVVEIDSRKLTYELKHKKKQVILKEIENVSFQRYGAWADTFPRITIKFKENAQIIFYPMNPLDPNSPLSAVQEAAAMVKIIKAFRKGEIVELNPNPYHRELIRQGRVADIAKRYWDPYVSPWVYYAQDHPHFHSPLLMVLLAIIPGLILIAIGLILNYLQ